MNILVTGVTGFIGGRLAARLSGEHRVVGLARGAYRGGADIEFVAGAFDRFEDLRALDGYRFDAVVHLAAVTGGCSEEDGLSVNVQGTRRLYRYLLDRGCRTFVTASSIAAVGSLDRDFLPLSLPMGDEHPCLARDAYGLSKSMVEELTRYFCRQTPDAEFVNLRFGSVMPDEWTPPVIDKDAKLSIPYVLLARVYASDVVEGIVRVLEAERKPRSLTCNLVGPDYGGSAPAIEHLRALLGDRAAAYDLSAYETPEGTYAPLYDMERMRLEFGFRPVKSTRAPLPGASAGL